MKTLKKALALTLIMSLGLSSGMTSAKWYNPFSWGKTPAPKAWTEKLRDGASTAVSAVAGAGQSVWNAICRNKAIALTGLALAATGAGIMSLANRLLPGEEAEEQPNEPGVDENESVTVDGPVVVDGPVTVDGPVVVDEPVVDNTVDNTAVTRTAQRNDLVKKVHDVFYMALNRTKNKRQFAPVDASAFPQEKRGLVAKLNSTLKDMANRRSEAARNACLDIVEQICS